MNAERARLGIGRRAAGGTALAAIAIAAMLGLAGCSTSTAHADTATSAAHRQTHPATSAQSTTTTPAAASTATTPSAAAPSAAAAAAAAAAASTAQAEAPSAALRQELLSAPVPALCNHAAGSLVNGALPGPLSAGYVRLAWLVGAARSQSALSTTGAFEGAGSTDVAAAIACSAGGVPWPEVVGVWTQDGSTLRLVGAYAPEQLSHNIVAMQSVQAVGSTIHIAWSGPAPGKDDADGSEHSSAVLTVADGRIIASGYHATVG